MRRGPAADLAVRLTPRGGADLIDGVSEGVLRVRVRAPAVDGAANAALIELLAHELGVAPSRLSIVRGATERRKVVRVEGLDPERLLERWPALRG